MGLQLSCNLLFHLGQQNAAASFVHQHKQKSRNNGYHLGYLRNSDLVWLLMAIANVGKTITLAVFCCAAMPLSFNTAISMTRACLEGVCLDDLI